MKVAISIPDTLFHEADIIAEDLGLSRSGFYARAVAESVRRHRDEIITEKLNAVYATEDSSLDPGFKELQRRVLELDPYIIDESNPDGTPPQPGHTSPGQDELPHEQKDR